MKLPTGHYRFEERARIYFHGETLTVEADARFSLVSSHAHGAPNWSETHRGVVREIDGTYYLDVKSVTAESYSPVDYDPTEETKPLQLRWRIEWADESTMIVHRRPAVRLRKT